LGKTVDSSQVSSGSLPRSSAGSWQASRNDGSPARLMQRLKFFDHL
jgi:hypothetical protein